MNLTNSKRGIRVFAAFAAVLAAASCTDADYDFSKEIDRTIDIDANLGVPIGSSEFIEIGSFLKLDEGEDSADSFFKLDGDNYLIAFDGEEPVEMELEAPDVTFEPQAMESVTVQYSDYDRQFVGKDPATLQSLYPGAKLEYEFDLKNPNDNSKDLVMDIDIDAELPDEVVDIESAVVHSRVTFNFELSDGKMTIRKGAEITFPDYIVVGTMSGDTEVETAGLHKIRLLKDIEVQGEESIEFIITEIDLSDVPGHGIVNDGGVRKLLLKDDILVTGQAEFNLLSFNPVPDAVRMRMYIGLETIEVESARVKLDFGQTFDSPEIELGEMPEFLSGGNVVLDFWNPVIKLTVDNGTPLTTRLDADIETFIGNERQAYVHIGANGPEGNRTDAIVLAPGRKTIALSRQGTSSLADAENIKVERFGDLLKTIPEKMSISGIEVSTGDEWLDVDLSDDSPFIVTMEYGLECPIAFGRDLHISYETTLEGLGDLFNASEQEGSSQMSIDLRTAEIKFNMLNTIPWNLSIAASALDEDGNPVTSGVQVALHGDIAAGSVNNPSYSPVSIAISATAEGIRALDSLLLTISLDGDEALEGMPLSRQMGIQLTDISARIAGNISFELGDGADAEDDE